MKEISGSGVALVTPFTNDDSINYEKLDELIEYHIKNETDFIVICGTTGESATLSINEKKELIRHTVEKFSGKIPIIAGTGTNSTSSSIELSKYASKVGVDGVLVVTPYYNKGNEDGLYLHFGNIAREIFPTPLILYNVPSRTGVDLSIPLIIKLSKISNIIGIKEANTSLEKIENIILNTQNSTFKVFSGNDNLTLPILQIGGSGVISVCANIIPKHMHDICTKKDLNLFYDYLELMNLMFLDTNPIMIKMAMNYLGFNVGNLRLPLYKTTDEKFNKLKKELDKIQ